MSQIVVRNLAPGVKSALKKEAATHGRSMEAEARKIITDYLMPDTSNPVLEWVEACEKDNKAGEDLPEIKRQPSREVTSL